MCAKPTEESTQAIPRFCIQLRSQGKPRRDFDKEYLSILSNDYAVSYLERIGVSPTESNIAHLLKRMPISKCKITATWRSNGWLNDALYVTPDGKDRSQERSQSSAFTVPDEPIPLKQQMAQKQQMEEPGRASTPGAATGTGGVNATVDWHTANTSNKIRKASQQSEQQRKFESMQAKHVYPFKQHYRASIKDHVDVADPPRADSNSDGTKNPWGQTPGMVAFRDMLQPLEISADKLQEILDNFCRIFPFQSFCSKVPSRKLKTLQDHVSSPIAIRLCGLLCHYLFWNFILPTVMNHLASHAPPGTLTNPPTLTTDEKQRLFLETMREFHELESKLRLSAIGVNVSMPCLLLALRTVVDQVFCSEYKWFRLDTERDGDGAPTPTQVLNGLQQEVTRLMDPDLYFSHIAPLGSSRAAVELASRPAHIAQNRKLRKAAHTTSAAIKTLYAHSSSADTRKIMAVGPKRRTQPVPPGDRQFNRPAVARREQLESNYQSKLYSSALMKIRRQYKQSYSKTNDREMLEREMLLEPISKKMVARHEEDLRRFHDELIEVKCNSHEEKLQHPGLWGL